MFRTNMTIAGFEPERAEASQGERRRKEEHVELIASENYASPRVLEAQGSVLTNKYAEGYPGKRYYGGCEYVDVAEQLAIDRAKKLFGADYANVQPHSGSQANAAAYLALVQPGDPILGMSLDHGGHLTHGAKVNFSGTQGGPLMHVIAAKAVALLEALQPEFREYQRQVLTNARAMAARLASRGYQIVSGGTDNHLFLMSLADRNLTGKDADAALGRANITVNKNAVPNDPRPPMVASGLRIGTPASTTRGFKVREVEQVADFVAEVLDADAAPAAIERVRPKVLELCGRFPVYGP